MFYGAMTLDELLNISIYHLDNEEEIKQYTFALREAYDLYTVEVEEEIEELRQQIEELKK
jgi:hypothetical protein